MTDSKIQNTAHNIGQGIKTTVTGEYGKKVEKEKCHINELGKGSTHEAMQITRPPAGSLTPSVFMK